MKTLLLLRHAKSSWDDPSLPDHDRPLNGRGKASAPMMGALILERGLVPERIVTSSAKRARKTAKLVAKACAYGGDIEREPALYLAGPDAYLRTIHALGDAPVDPLMLVGHNPDMEDLIVLLTGQAARMPTAALAVIALDVADWSQVRFDETAKLVNVWRPRELA